jgi:hypothetical protein
MNLIELYWREVKESNKVDERREENKAAKVLEALVGQLPVTVVEAFVSEWDAAGSYADTIQSLRNLAHERREKGFPPDIREAD